LEAKREQVQKSIDSYDVILSPARRIPPDILREVFYRCLTACRNPTLSATEAPMLLTRVCSLWRSVALSTPQIWAKLYIPLPGDPRLSSSYGVPNDRALEVRRQIFSKTMQLRCEAVKEWLDRSGSCPLSLSISYPFGYVSNNGVVHDEFADSLFQIICPSASRWKHLDLSLPLDIYQKLETNIPLDSLSMLRGFKGNIFFQDSTPLVGEPTMIPLQIIELPALEALSINCLQLTLNISRYRNSWNRLTEICFHSSVSDTDLLKVLKQCHNLITLETDMQIPWVRETIEPTSEVVLLPHLESLKLRETGPCSTAFLAVHAPSLKSLQYRCPHRYANFGVHSEHTSFEPLSFLMADSLIWLVSNAPTLKTLSIDPRTLRPEDVLECLRLATHLQELIFGDAHTALYPNLAPNIEEDVLPNESFDLEIFTVPDDESSATTLLRDDILLPNLESLEANDTYKIDDDKLRRILTSRIDAAQRGLTSPLGRVKILLGRRKEGDIVSEIVTRARDVGMEMKLELVYLPSGLPYIGRLSPSFLLPDNPNDGNVRCRVLPSW